MRGAAWLFVRASESIWLQRSSERDLELIVLGPGPARHVYVFRNEEELQNFQGQVEQRLVTTGWILEAFSPERRAGRDRRQTARAEDRRH